MEKHEIIKNIAARTNGDIYLGIVGAVRTGKSTFIKKFMEHLIIPTIEDENEQRRAKDELPQSAAGRTIMTTEPKFVPNQAQKIQIDDFSVNVRLVDCVGYVIDDALGYEDENGSPRMVMTPWYEESIPFVEAAKIGTEKVIKDHSTIGIVVTTDGSIGEFNRSDYLEGEKLVLENLDELGKPYIVIMNSTHPMMPETVRMCEDLQREVNVPVIPLNIDTMNEKDIYSILREALYEFPVIEIHVNVPEWISNLNNEHWLKRAFIDQIKISVEEIDKVREITSIQSRLVECPYIKKALIKDVDTSSGIITINMYEEDGMFDKVMEEIIGCEIHSKGDLISLLQDYNEAKCEYDQIKGALKMVKATGYGIASPIIDDMKLDTPEIIKQSGRYGVKLKAVAPSIHMIKVDVESTFEPIIGSEYQSKELIDYLMRDYDKDPLAIWDSEIFGRSLSTIVNEGIQAKLSLMPENARYKLQDTLEKIINKGNGGMIAIIL